MCCCQWRVVRAGRQSAVIRSGVLIACLAIASCSSDRGPTRYRVSGEVKVAGQSVPYGEILFTPDSSKGNSGPQGIAIIQQGKYDTAGSRSTGRRGRTNRRHRHGAG